MNNIKLLTMVTILAFISIACMVQTRPNIVMIMADDLGQRDLPVYGNRFNEAPHIDKLATQGLVFTQACPDSTSSCNETMRKRIPPQTGAAGEHDVTTYTAAFSCLTGRDISLKQRVTKMTPQTLIF